MIHSETIAPRAVGSTICPSGLVDAATPVPQPALVQRVAHWLHTLLRVLPMLVGVGVVLAAVAAVRGVVADGDWMYSDGTQLYHVLRIRDGLPLYPDIAESPFIAFVYWPLYLVAAGFLARAADLGVDGALYVTRALSVLGTLVAAGSIASLAVLSGARRFGAFIAGGLFLTSYVVHPWAYAARADLPALGLVLFGLVVLLRIPSWWGAIAAGLITAAGFACKQTYVVGVAVAVLAMFWQRQWTRGIILGGVWTVSVGMVALVMTMVTDGKFLTNTVSSNVLPFRAETVLSHLAAYGPMSLPVLSLASVGWRGVGRAGTALGLMRLYAVVAAVAGLFALARAGSYYNHLLEITAVLAVFAGVGVDRCAATFGQLTHQTDGPRHPLLAAIIPTAALFVAVAGSGIPLLALAFKAIDPPVRSDLIRALRDAPGPVLTERDALAVVLAGKEPIGGDPLGTGLLAAQGKWDPSPLNEFVRSQTFALIALNRPVEEAPAFDTFSWWPPDTRELIQRHYRLDHRLRNHYLYVPNEQVGRTITDASVIEASVAGWNVGAGGP